VNAEQTPGEEMPNEEMPSEEEIRARLEEELKKISVRDVLLQSAVTLVNLGGQRLGLSPTSRDARNLEESRIAIEALRALVPLLEEQNAEEVRPLRDALAQLQMAYAHEVQSAGAEGDTDAEGGGPVPPPPGQGRPAAEPQPGARQTGTGRRPSPRGGLWVPPGSDS
jgi:hypothetical protein